MRLLQLKRNRAFAHDGRKDTWRNCQSWSNLTPYSLDAALGHLIQVTGTPWAQPLMTVLPVWGCQSYKVMEMSTQVSESGDFKTQLGGKPQAKSGTSLGERADELQIARAQG